ncbi:AtzH-like domain-containing protein [Frigoribacterium sp. 2-23]|uniref:AtzH-like domain-containing protein n=1 Tax=Frigoribacterium sp. 2-23 TaxID=3415006 RepID=UPI003C6F97CD
MNGTTPAASEPVPTTLEGELPDGLLAAFDAYERALADGDLDALADAFEPGPLSMRADASGLLVGHDAIQGFRGRRGSAPVRRIESRHVRALDADTALIVSVNVPVGGGRGVVTQLWRRHDDGSWRIASAQVQAPTGAIDRRVWRIVGDPLIPARLAGVGAAKCDQTGGDGPKNVVLTANSAETVANCDDSPGRAAVPAPGPAHERGQPLAGRTVAVKDLFAVAGHAIGAGVPAYLAGAPVETVHAPAVQALLDAGASVLGIAQTDEFAYSIAGRNSAYGTPPNPAVPGGVSGGSSSGPASAVALGQADIGLGTDTGGSIRVPASYQGLWGLRTTHGAVDRRRLLPLAPTFDTVGWLTRSADLLHRAADSTLVRADQRPVEASFVVDPSLLGLVQPEVRDAFVAATEGLQPERVDLGDVPALFELFRVVQAFEAWQSHGKWITAHPGELAPEVAARFAFGAGLEAERVEEARVALDEERHRLDMVLRDRVLLLPSASSAAPSLGATAAEVDATRTATLGLTCVAGVGGYPAVSAPVMRVSGGPVGLCLVGPRYTDLALIELAASVFAG